MWTLTYSLESPCSASNIKQCHVKALICTLHLVLTKQMLIKTSFFFLRAKLQHTAAFVQLPIGLESDVKGIIDLIRWKAYYFEGDQG